MHESGFPRHILRIRGMCMTVRGGGCRFSTMPSASRHRVPGTLRGPQHHANAGSLPVGVSGGPRKHGATGLCCRCLWAFGQLILDLSTQKHRGNTWICLNCAACQSKFTKLAAPRRLPSMVLKRSACSDRPQHESRETPQQLISVQRAVQKTARLRSSLSMRDAAAAPGVQRQPCCCAAWHHASPMMTCKPVQ